MRSDRVIAEAWDATFTLYDGVPDAATVERLRAQVPLQEAGRISDQELTLARANRSVRLFEYVIATLASGQQPDAHELAKTGYLMRTTAVYGSGKFGAIDRRFIRARPELRRPFQAELLSVYLIRLFTFDIVNQRVNHRVITNFNAFTLRHVFGLAVRADVKRKDWRIRRRGELNI